MGEEVANSVWSQSQRNWNLGKASHGAPHCKTQPSWYGLLGSPVCVSLSDWINERHVFPTILESGKSGSLALGFQHINLEETQAICSNVSPQAKSHHPSCLTLSLLHLICILLSFVLFAPQLKCSTSLYDSESSLSKINVSRTSS